MFLILLRALSHLVFHLLSTFFFCICMGMRRSIVWLGFGELEFTIINSIGRIEYVIKIPWDGRVRILD
jgi:hypothetical protein